MAFGDLRRESDRREAFVAGMSRVFGTASEYFDLIKESFERYVDTRKPRMQQLVIQRDRYAVSANAMTAPSLEIVSTATRNFHGTGCVLIQSKL
jgi:hypothetical protein